MGFSFLETRNASVRAIRVQITFRSVYVYHSEFHNSFSVPSVLTQIGVKLVAKSWKIPSVFLNITMRILICGILVLLMLQDLTKEILTAHTTCGSFIRRTSFSIEFQMLGVVQVFNEYFFSEAWGPWELTYNARILAGSRALSVCISLLLHKHYS